MRIWSESQLASHKLALEKLRQGASSKRRVRIARAKLESGTLDIPLRLGIAADRMIHRLLVEEQGWGKEAVKKKAA